MIKFCSNFVQNFSTYTQVYTVICDLFWDLISIIGLLSGYGQIRPCLTWQPWVKRAPGNCAISEDEAFFSNVPRVDVVSAVVTFFVDIVLPYPISACVFALQHVLSQRLYEFSFNASENGSIGCVTFLTWMCKQSFISAFEGRQ